MKHFLFFGILLISTILVAGWRWEEAPTTNAPMVPTYWPYWHMAYEPNLGMVVITFKDGAELQTWGFDGQTWVQLASYDDWQDAGCDYREGMMVFSKKAGRLYDFVPCSPNFEAPGLTEILTYDAMADSWSYLTRTGAIITRGAYDSARQVVVTIGFDYPDGMKVMEFDGANWTDTPLPGWDWFFPGFLTYDASIQRVLNLGANSPYSSDFLAWDGKTWEELPSLGDYSYIGYDPDLEGSITVLPWLGTWLFHDMKWYRLNKNENHIPFGRLIYFDHLHKMYAITTDASDMLHAYVLTEVRTHDRPFNRP